MFYVVGCVGSVGGVVACVSDVGGVVSSLVGAGVSWLLGAVSSEDGGVAGVSLGAVSPGVGAGVSPGVVSPGTVSLGVVSEAGVTTPVPGSTVAAAPPVPTWITTSLHG